MNCCRPLTTKEIEDRRISKQIEKKIKKDKENVSKETRLLLLGTGESGKSTFVKQMRIIHDKGFTDKEKRQQVKSVHQNLVFAMQSMINAMHNLNIECKDSPEITGYINQIKTINVNDMTFNSSLVIALKKLWEFEGIQETYRNRRYYHLSDSTEYFFSHIDRVSHPQYLPNEEDIVRVRVQTNGVQEYDFISKDLKLRLTDVGGQRSERKKWLDVFECCDAIIFVSAISEYDQVLMEDGKTNRLLESVKLFGKIVNYIIFKHKSNILFLNKIDLLELKIEESNLIDYFPNFDGDKKDAMSAQAFIKQLFVNEKIKDKDDSLYIYFTCATDKNNIQKVFETVKAIIIDANVKYTVI